MILTETRKYQLAKYLFNKLIQLSGLIEFSMAQGASLILILLLILAPLHLTDVLPVNLFKCFDLAKKAMIKRDFQLLKRG